MLPHFCNNRRENWREISAALFPDPDAFCCTTSNSFANNLVRRVRKTVLSFSASFISCLYSERAEDEEAPQSRGVPADCWALSNHLKSVRSFGARSAFLARSSPSCKELQGDGCRQRGTSIISIRAVKSLFFLPFLKSGTVCYGEYKGERGILLSYNLDLCTLVFCLRVPEEGPINPIKDVIWAQMRCGGNHGTVRVWRDGWGSVQMDIKEQTPSLQNSNVKRNRSGQKSMYNLSLVIS